MANMKNGLSYFDDGGSVASVPVTTAKSKTGVTPAGTTSLGPEQTESILANMQALIDKRTGPMSTFLGGLQEASAWGAGGEHGPSAALTAVRRQRQLEEADTMGMQEKMAAFRAAQAKAERDAKQVSQFMGGTGEAGGGGGVPNLSLEAQARLKLTSDPTEQKAIISEDLKTRAGERAKAEFNPASMKAEEYVYIRNPRTGQIEAKQVSLQGYMDLKAKGLIVPESELYKVGPKPTTAAPVAGATRTTENILSQIQNSVFQTESSGGKADTSKPGVQGAIGPMQITQDTWNTNVARGVIPKNLDINNPKDNKLAGDKLLEYYYNKFGGDVDKTLAAYHGGEGAINPDGTINTSRKDANGMTIGNYIAKNKAQISSAPAATTTAAPVPAIPDISKIKAEKAVEETFRKEQAQISAQSSKKEIEGFKSATEVGSVNNQIYLAKRLGELTTKYKDNPRIVALLNNPDMTSAVAGLIVDGLNTPVGSLSFKGLEDAFQKTMPGTTTEEINARQELRQILKSYALEASKVGQGQGAMSDFERQMFEQIAGSTSNSMDMLRRVQRVMEARANFNEKIGRAFEDSYEAGKPQDFQLFKKSEAYRNAVKEHREALLGITKDLEANPSGGPQNKAAGTPKWNHTEDEYNKWKKSKGIK